MNREELKNWCRNNLFRGKDIHPYKIQEADMSKKSPEEYQALMSYTSFITERLPLNRRVFCVLNELYAEPICKICGKEVRFFSYNRGYNRYCSRKCTNADIEVTNKQEANRCESNMKKYGEKHTFAVQEVKNTIEQTMVARYEVKNPMQNQLCREKAKKTNMERRGVAFPSQCPKVQEKAKQTNLRIRGVEYSLQAEDVKVKSKVTIREIYGVDNVSQAESVKLQKEQKSIEMFGTKNPFQSEAVKNKIKNDNFEEYGVWFACQRHIPRESMEILGDKEKMQALYEKNTATHASIGEMLGTTSSVVGKAMKKLGIEAKQEYARSVAEQEIVDFIGLPDTLTNKRRFIYPFEIDIYLPNYRIGIEYNGDYWHSLFTEKDHHLNKTIMCEARRIRLLHIFESEWKDPRKKEIWKSIINDKLGRNAKVETVIVGLVSDTREFLEQNHLEGHIDSEMNLGLFYKNELVSLACFTDNRLFRYCDRVGYNVQDSFSILLEHYGKSVIYLANRRWNCFPGCITTGPNPYVFQRYTNWDCGNWVCFWEPTP